MIRQTLSVVLVWSLVASAGALCLSLVGTSPAGSPVSQQVVSWSEDAVASFSAASELEMQLETTSEMGPCIEPNGLV